tara:strand:- start:620 stop:913 length:294 start_codon:yes stop_codon:yes gene_type:complete
MEANKEQEVQTLSISDGVDSATLTSIRNGWKVELNVPGGESENKQRLLEASAQAIALNSGGRLEYWIEGQTTIQIKFLLPLGTLRAEISGVLHGLSP